MRGTCSTCRHWSVTRYPFIDVEGDIYVRARYADGERGDCRRHAPTIVDVVKCGWPKSLGQDGCGDHAWRADARGWRRWRSWAMAAWARCSLVNRSEPLSEEGDPD